MISVTNGLGKAIHLIDPLKLITVQKVRPPTVHRRAISLAKPSAADRLRFGSAVYSRHIFFQSIGSVFISAIDPKQASCNVLLEYHGDLDRLGGGIHVRRRVALSTQSTVGHERALRTFSKLCLNQNRSQLRFLVSPMADHRSV